MHIDQFELSSCKHLLWLANPDTFAQVVQEVHRAGGTVGAYVGSPLVIGRSPEPTYLPKSTPGATRLSVQLRALSRLGACRRLPPAGCLCWTRLVRFHIDPLVSAGVDAIGLDASPDFHPGDCMDRLVRWLLARGIEVMIEPWPRRDRDYPPVSWIIREIMYQRVTLDPRDRWAPLESVRGKIYRIVPADGPDGTSELDEINHFRTTHGAPAFASVQAVIDDIQNAGHIPAIRAAQLSSGDFT
jgi:hypothetical protein